MPKPYFFTSLPFSSKTCAFKHSESRNASTKKSLDNYLEQVKHLADEGIWLLFWRLIPPSDRLGHPPQAQLRTIEPTHMMQNYYCKTIGALAAASAIVAGNATAGSSQITTTAPATQADAITYDLHAGFASEYLWRGQDLGDRLVDAGFDAQGTWNGIDLSGGLWYGDFQAPTGYHPSSGLGSANASELDITLQAGKKFGAFSADVGYIYYNYPQGSANRYLVPVHDNQEIYFQVGYDFGFVQSSLTYFWSVAGQNNQGYTELALARAFPINPAFTLNLATNLGYQVEMGRLTAWTSKASLDYAFAQHAKFSPFIAASVALSDNDYSYYTAGSKNQLVGGAEITVTF